MIIFSIAVITIIFLLAGFVFGLLAAIWTLGFALATAILSSTSFVIIIISIILFKIIKRKQKKIK